MGYQTTCSASRQINLDFAAEPVKQVRGPGSRQGSWTDRGALCTCEQGECCVCACTSDLISLPAREEEGVSTIYVYVLHESCWRQPLAEAACVTGHVSVLCVSVTLGYMLSFTTGWTYKMKVIAAAPSLGRDPCFPDTRLGPSGWTAVVLCLTGWRKCPHWSPHLTFTDGCWCV